MSQAVSQCQSNLAGRFPMPANLCNLEYMDVGNAEYGELGYGDVEYVGQGDGGWAQGVLAVLDV